MKSIVIYQADFEAIESSQFTFAVREDNREFENNSYPAGYDDEGNVEYRDCYNSFVAGEATAKHGELEVKFWWVANGGNKSYQNAFDFTIEIDYNGNKNYETNFSIIDEDSDEVEDWRFDDMLKEKLDGAAWEYEVKKLLPEAEIEDLDTDEDEDMTEEMREITVERDNAADLRFTGVNLAWASSKDPYNNGGRWTELALYKTKGGKFVCAEVGRTCWQGEHYRFGGAVCETEQEVIKYFGHGRLAKEIYEVAGINAAEEVE